MKYMVVTITVSCYIERAFATLQEVAADLVTHHGFELRQHRAIDRELP